MGLHLHANWIMQNIIFWVFWGY